MACSDCDICTLIDDECLWKYTPLKGISLKSITDIVDAVNLYIKDLSGSCDLCKDWDDEAYIYDDVIAAEEFKRLYAQLVYMFWLDIRGGGHPSREGMVAKNDDPEFSGFRVLRGSEIDHYRSVQRQLVDKSEAAWVAWMKENKKTCFSTTSSSCDTCCNGVCTCSSSTDDYDLDFATL